MSRARRALSVNGWTLRVEIRDDCPPVPAPRPFTWESSEYTVEYVLGDSIDLHYGSTKGGEDPISVRASGLPSWLSFTGEDRVKSRFVQGTADALGTFKITFTATDGRGQTAQGAITVVVEKMSFRAKRRTYREQREPSKCWMSLVSGGTAPITYSWTGKPDWLSITITPGGDRYLRGTPPHAGPFEMTLHATDADGDKASVVIEIQGRACSGN